jgi:hypothetical protein
MSEDKRCKAFEDCIQPHICGASTECIWGSTPKNEPTSKELIMMTISEIQKESWNDAIEAAAKVADDVAGLMASDAIRKLRK